jgi:nicotinamidase/pyrazinamidase
VLYSAEDARREGFEVIVVEDACRAIDLGGSLGRARVRMAEIGVALATSAAIQG